MPPNKSDEKLESNKGHVFVFSGKKEKEKGFICGGGGGGWGVFLDKAQSLLPEPIKLITLNYCSGE